MDVNQGGGALRRNFQSIVAGESTSEGLVTAIREIVRPETNVTHVDEGATVYNITQDAILISNAGMSVGQALHVSEHNLPPNTPKEVTSALLVHLSALHEAEHSMQYRRQADPDSGRVSIFFKTLDGENESEAGNMLLSEALLGEADSDYAVVKHLQDMEYKHIGQFYLDIRAGGSMTEHLIATPIEAGEHDTSSIIGHFLETGETMDAQAFIEAKWDLASKLREETGISGVPMEILGKYNLSYEYFVQNFDALAPEPQGVMHAVQTMLDRGDFEGLQKWEAENYLASMERLGYKADPDFNYETQLRRTFENEMGLSPATGLRLDEMEIEAPQGATIPVTQ